MKKYFLSILIVLGVYQLSFAQDIHFSQFPEMTTLRNPALTGIFSGEYKVGVDYRNQWSQVTSNPYKTIVFAGETRILVDHNVGDYLSFGLNISSDKAGAVDFVSNEIYPAICFNKCMEDEHNTYLSLGMTGGYFSRSVDFSKMTTTSQYVNRAYDNMNPSNENTQFNRISNYDLGTGVSLNSSFDLEGISNYYIGAALYHLNHPVQTFFRQQMLVYLPLKWEFGTGFHINMGPQFGLTFHANYSYQEPYNELMLGGLLSWHNTPILHPSNFVFSLGSFFRYNDMTKMESIVPIVKIEFNNVAVGFSQDISMTPLANAVPGTSATEITIFIKGNYNHKKDPRDNVMCPKFDEQVYNHFR